MKYQKRLDRETPSLKIKLDRSISIMENKVLVGFRFDYNTAIGDMLWK